MGVSAIRVQDKDTGRKLSVVESTECPGKFGLVLVNPDGSRIKGPKGDPGPQGCPGPTGPYICSAGFNGDDIDFGRSDGGVVKLEDAKLCLQGPQGNPGPTGNGICCTQLNPDYTLTLQYTNGCSDTTGSIRGCQGEQGDTGNGICCTICNKTGKETTIELQYTNHTCFCFSVCDGQDGEGSGDVLGPASSVDGDVVAFDGASGKYIKDSGVNISDLARCCDIPTDNSELANGCGYTSCIGTLQACDLCGYAKTCDIPTDNCQLSNGCGYIKGINCSDVTTALGYTPYNNTNPCGYTSCTGTLVPSDLNGYAKSCDLCAVATSGKYCDLDGRVTDNCQIGNGCGYTNCIGTLTADNICDAAFGSSWDSVTDKAPSMNAIYDVLGDVETLLANI